MDKDDMLTIYDYNYWANQRILQTARGLSPDQFRSPSAFSFGSLRAVLVHIFYGESLWRRVCQVGELRNEPAESEFAELRALENRWALEELAMREFLGSLSDEEMGRPVRYTTGHGERRERVLWHCLLHVVNHGTQHRSEAAELLTSFGHSPGDLDITWYLLSAS